MPPVDGVVKSAMSELIRRKIKPEWPEAVKKLKYKTKYLSVARLMLG